MFGEFLRVLKVGESVANPAAWKKGQITGTMVGILILGLVHLAKRYNVQIPVDQTTADLIGGGIVAIANVVLTLSTSKTVGIGVAPVVQPIDPPNTAPADAGPGSVYPGGG